MDRQDIIVKLRNISKVGDWPFGVPVCKIKDLLIAAADMLEREERMCRFVTKPMKLASGYIYGQHYCSECGWYFVGYIEGHNYCPGCGARIEREGDLA